MLLAAKSLHISRVVQISSYPYPFLTICGLPVLTSKKRHILSCIFKPKTMAKLKFRRPLFRYTNIFIRNLE